MDRLSLVLLIIGFAVMIGYAVGLIAWSVVGDGDAHALVRIGLAAGGGVFLVVLIAVTRDQLRNQKAENLKEVDL
jgi:hypothetical protein